VWINKEHGERAFPYIEEAIRQLTFLSTPKFSPVMAFQIIPRLMNSMVVSVMSGNIHASLKALEGYCMFHLILIEFVGRYPELQVAVNNKVRQFISDDSFRHKTSTPNLGEFLPLIAVSSEFTWDDIAIPYLEENLTRNVLWVIKKHPRRANIGKHRPGTADTQTQQNAFRLHYLNALARVSRVFLPEFRSSAWSFNGGNCK